MITRWYCRAAVLAGAIGLAGCGKPGRVDEKTIEVQEQPALNEAKSYLENYAKGQKLGSEVTQFERIVTEVRKTDPQRATALEKGFAELQKKGADTKGTAKEILRDIAPKQGP
jgi:hypothetical protein